MRACFADVPRFTIAKLSEKYFCFNVLLIKYNVSTCFFVRLFVVVFFVVVVSKTLFFSGSSCNIIYLPDVKRNFAFSDCVPTILIE